MVLSYNNSPKMLKITEKKLGEHGEDLSHVHPILKGMFSTIQIPFGLLAKTTKYFLKNLKKAQFILEIVSRIQNPIYGGAKTTEGFPDHTFS